MRENVIKGKTTGGNIALGYRIGADKRFEIVEEQAVIVRKIFQMYAEGSTFAEIITELNSMGLKTSRGNPYNKSSISRILSNERYIGRYTIKGIDEVAECPRIIDDELFKTVQNKLSESQVKHRHRTNHTYLLSGVLHCGECGERMTGTGGTSRYGKRYYYYHCRNKHFGRIDADVLEGTVLNTIDEYLQTDKIYSVAKTAFEEYKKQILDTSELNAVQKELKQTEKKLSNAVNAVLSGLQSETIQNTITELETQKSDLLARESMLRQRAPKFTLEMFVTAVKNLADTPSATLINTIISRIDYLHDFIIFYFRLFDVDGSDPEKIEIPFNIKGACNVASPPPIENA